MHQKQHHKQDQSARARNIVKYFKEHAFINGWLYYELIGSLTEQNDANPKALLTKLAIATICQLALRCLKSPTRKHDDDTKK